MIDAPGQPGGLDDIVRRLRTVSDDRLLAALDKLDPVLGSAEATALIREARPRLQRLRPLRPPTLRRCFCFPFEDLLHDGTDARPGRVGRLEITPLWQALVADRPGAVEDLHRSLTGIPRTAPDRILAVGLKLWSLAAQSFEGRTIPSAPSAPLVGAVLAAAGEIEAFKSAHPIKPLNQLTGPALETVVRTVGTLKSQGRPLNGYLLVIAARLASPEDLVAALHNASASLPIGLVQSIDALAIDHIARRSDSLARTWSDAEPDSLARDLSALARYAGETRTALGLEAKAALHRQTAQSTAALKTALRSRILEPVDAAVMAVLRGSATESDWRQATQAARALRQSLPAARELGLSDEAEAITTRVATRIRGALDGALQTLEQTQGPRDPGETDPLYRLIRLIETVGGSAGAQPYLARMARLSRRPG